MLWFFMCNDIDIEQHKFIVSLLLLINSYAMPTVGNFNNKSYCHFSVFYTIFK